VLAPFSPSSGQPVVQASNLQPHGPTRHRLRALWARAALVCSDGPVETRDGPGPNISTHGSHLAKLTAVDPRSVAYGRRIGLDDREQGWG
jgi:hypothetical protein